MRTDDEEIPAEAIARMIHETVREFGAWLDDSCLDESWGAMDEDQQEAKTAVVRLIQRGFPYDYVHQIWVDKMLEDGWTRGYRDPARKQHPCILPWDSLPFWEQQKVVLAFHIVQGATSRGR